MGLWDRKGPNLDQNQKVNLAVAEAGSSASVLVPFLFPWLGKKKPWREKLRTTHRYRHIPPSQPWGLAAWQGSTGMACLCSMWCQLGFSSVCGQLAGWPVAGRSRWLRSHIWQWLGAVSQCYMTLLCLAALLPVIRPGLSHHGRCVAWHKDDGGSCKAP